MRISIENKLYMDCPEGFRVMTEEERTGMNLAPDGRSLGIRDSARHIIITVERSQVNELASMLMGTREVAWNMTRQIEKRLKKFSFVWLNDIKRTVDGQPARGMDYEYTANGIGLSCESFVVKVEKDLYFFHMYAVKALIKESMAAFEAVLDTVVIPE